MTNLVIVGFLLSIHLISKNAFKEDKRLTFPPFGLDIPGIIMHVFLGKGCKFDTGMQLNYRIRKRKSSFPLPHSILGIQRGKASTSAQN